MQDFLTGATGLEPATSGLTGRYSATGYDRLLATRFGGAAVRAVADRKWGYMVALQTPHIVCIPIAEALAEPKRVDPTHDVVQTARETGISFGE